MRVPPFVRSPSSFFSDRTVETDIRFLAAGCALAPHGAQFVVDPVRPNGACESFTVTFSSSSCRTLSSRFACWEA